MKKKIHKLNLEELGYSDFFADQAEKTDDKNLTPARIIAEHKEMYILRNETSELSAKVTGVMMFTASSRIDYPAVGDWVFIKILDDAHSIIHKILPRKTVLARKSVHDSGKQIIASNIDTAFIIQSPDRDYSLNRFERYIALTTSENIKPVIILNKTDLISEDELNRKLTEINTRFKNTEIHATSILTGKGISGLIKSIKPGQTHCFLGSSGVGKSSVINTILGKNRIKTADISSSTKRGRHITTHRELFILENGGIVIDNPGMREVGILDSEKGIRNVFSEIAVLSKNCRYSDCNHICERGCAVLSAVESGHLEKAKYDHYLKLRKENEYNTMTQYEKREKDRKFGKFIKTAKKQMKRYQSDWAF